MNTLEHQRDETGASTAEYAAVTCGGLGLAGVLIKFLSSDFGQKLMKGLIDYALEILPF